jgi:hypothetical protein
VGGLAREAAWPARCRAHGRCARTDRTRPRLAPSRAHARLRGLRPVRIETRPGARALLARPGSTARSSRPRGTWARRDGGIGARAADQNPPSPTASPGPSRSAARAPGPCGLPRTSVRRALRGD